MKRYILIFFVSIITIGNVNAQSLYEVKGILKDSTGQTIIGATVRLISSEDTISTATGIDGDFLIKKVKSPDFSLHINALGYKPFIKNYKFSDPKEKITLQPIVLMNDAKLLKELIVDGTPDVVVKEDTLQYRADQYNLRENALAEDLLKKLPGVEVDRDGNITAQGKQITKVRVNGKDFFGGDVKTATQQLPADILQNVQIIDDYGDQANITGIKDGDPEKILNFVIKADKNKGYLTRGTVGVGDKDRYQASVFAAKFNNNQQLSLLANLNNINANIFNLTQDGGGERRGPGGGGFSFSPSGLTDVKSIGLNYRDQWSQKLTVYGSYSVFGRNNTLTTSRFKENIMGGNTIDDDRNSNSETNNVNHRFDFNLEYQIDSLNYLKVTPKITFSTNDLTDASAFTIYRNELLSSDGNSTNNNNGKSPNLGADILYNHRFAGTKRNISVSAYLNSVALKSEQDYLNKSIEYGISPINTVKDLYRRQLIENDNETNNINVRTSYIEPLSKTKSLELNYEYGYNNINNTRTVLNTDDELQIPSYDQSLSDDYKYSFTTNRIGVNYRVRQEKFNYTLGFGLQPSILKGKSYTRDTYVKNTALNVFPSLRFQYKFSRSKDFNINYNGRSKLPSYNQLQPITDNSNPQYPVVGNPNLNAEFTNRINIRYNSSDINTGNTFFSSLNFRFTKDKIVSVTKTQNMSSAEAIQERSYTNANGYFTVNGFYSYNRQLKDKKYVFGLMGTANYNNNISFVDDAKNTAKNWILSQRLQIQILPKEWLEIVPSASYTFNTTNNTINTRSNTEIHTWSTAFDSKIYFTKTFLWGAQADKNFNRGFNNISQNPFIINTYIEKQFFKGNVGALRLTAFDLLDENTAISRTVADNYILDSRSNRLSRYFMLTFTMRLNKFAGTSNPVDERNNENMKQRFREGAPKGGGRPGGGFFPM